MWYVKNITNGKKLEKFKNLIILPFFQTMIDYKREKYTSSYSDYLEEKKLFFETKKKELLLKEKRFLSDAKKNDVLCNIQRCFDTIKSIELLIYIIKRKNDKICFSDLVQQLLAKSHNDLKKYFYFYIIQNEAIKNKRNSIDSVDIPDGLKCIFTDFFYGKLLVSKKIWKMIDGTYYSREIFHHNFSQDNDIYVCPYCDSAQLAIGEIEVEHFFPKSKYPLLSMCAMNMFSSCIACNHIEMGKGTAFFMPIVLPSYMQISNEVRFVNKYSQKKISVISSDEMIRNYCDLIKLEKKYSDKITYKRIIAESESIYETILEARERGIEVDDELKEKYIKRKIKPKLDPLYFVVRGIMN